MRRMIPIVLVLCGAGNAWGVGASAATGEPPAITAAAESTREQARAMISRAHAYLIAAQDPATGGWSISPTGPNFPGISGLVVMGLAERQLRGELDEAGRAALDRGVAYLLAQQQPDGGIYNGLLPSYNTSIAIAALSKVDSEAARAGVKRALDFLLTLQWGEGATPRPGLDESAQVVPSDHPFYGGWGYGRHGRPDLSNTAWAIEALHAAGLPEDDPAYARALTFLQRIQMDERINTMPYAAGSRQGGFIYATSENSEKIGVGQSMAGMMDETLSDGTAASRLRSYGSMTYSGFKSLIYAGLTRDDPRVLAAHGWLRRHYTLAENPGLGTDGMYYYFVALARALDAFGEPTITPITPDAPEGGTPRAWGADVVARLAELQNPDGDFRSVDDRWMENNPVLITAYGVLALQAAGGR